VQAKSEHVIEELYYCVVYSGYREVKVMWPGYIYIYIWLVLVNLKSSWTILYSPLDMKLFLFTFLGPIWMPLINISLHQRREQKIMSGIGWLL